MIKTEEEMQDKAIVELFLERNERAIREASEKYNHYCMHISMNILDNIEDSEECVNDALLGAWKSIPPHHPENLAAFLGKLTRNAAINKYNARHADKRAAGEYAVSIHELDECIPDMKDVESHADAVHLEQVIDEFLRGQKPANGNIFLLRYYYSCPVSDISKRMGISEGTIKSTLSRIRRRLKDYLKKEGVW